MKKDRFIALTDTFLLVATFVAVVSFIAFYGFYMETSLLNIIRNGAFILTGILVLDNILMLLINGRPWEEFRERRSLYIVTALILIHFLLIRFDVYGGGAEGHLSGYFVAAQVYIVFMFIIKLTKVNRLVFPGINWRPEQLFILSFLGVIVIGTLFLSFPRATIAPGSMPLIDAFFTSTSAVCVTGLIVVDTAVYFTRFGQFVILALIQVGGLGLMTFTSFFTIFFFKTMSFRERFLMSDVLSTDYIGGVHKIIGKILTITFTIEAAGALLLFTSWHDKFRNTGEALFHSVFHAVSSFCNAGFSTFSTSLAAFRGDVSVNLIVMFLIILGGLGFLVLMDFFQPLEGRRRMLMVQTKLVLTTSLLLILAGAVLFFIMESSGVLQGFSLKEKLLASFFQAVTPRTAGFNTVNIGLLSAPMLLIFTLFMFIGASPGSTGGGIKTTTFGILVATVWSYLKSRDQVILFKRRIPSRLAYRAMSLVIISFAYLFIVYLFLIVSEDFSLMDTLFEMISAFGTVGLSTGVTPHLSSAGKVAIMLTMFVGRLGPMTLALALSRSEKSVVTYPEETSIMVG
ncbi:Trk family potassium uptake protein [Candidatus Mcinerneyibacteriota bacterium]|nr:Trk family potassium uptake protein [Candidatus Mcinerneyibacteriota bacterium]